MDTDKSNKREPGNQDTRHDAFISYSRRDRLFAEKLETALEKYRPPKALPVPQRHLKVFRDEQDMTGTDYFQAVDHHLQNSASLIVICSPNARKSSYVDDEIRRFVSKREDPVRIVPVLVAGLPNNECNSSNTADAAFPQALYDVMEMPLAVSYLNFNTRRDKLNTGIYDGSWYTLIANLYGLNRSEVEQRERTRRRRRRALVGSLVTSIVLILSIATAVAWWQKREADQQRDKAVSRELAASSLASLNQDPERSILLALRGLDTTITKEAEHALHRAVGASRVRFALSNHRDRIYDIAYGPKGDYLASVGDEGTINFARASTGEKLFKLLSDRSEKTAIAIDATGNHIAAGSANGRIYIWKLAASSEVRIISAHKGLIEDLDFVPGAARLVSGGADGKVKLWDIEIDDPLLSMDAHEGTVYAVAVSADGQTIASTGADRKTRLWSLGSGRSVMELPSQKDDFYSVSFSPDCRELATAAGDRTVRIWNLRTGNIRLVLTGHTDKVYDAQFSPDGKRIGTAGRDKTARVWDTETGNPILVLTGHTRTVSRVSWNSHGTRLASASDDGTARIWNVSVSEELITLSGHESGVWAVEYSADNDDSIVTASGDGSVRLWDSYTGRTIETIASGRSELYTVALAPAEQLIAIGGRGGEVDVLSMPLKEPIFTLSEHSSSVMDVAFSPDGSLLATASWDGTARVWSNEGELIHILDAHTDEVWAVDFSSDGTQLVTSSRDHNVIIWELSSGRELRRLKGHADAIYDVSFDPSGERVATASRDETARIWYAATSTSIHTLHHGAAVHAIAWSPQGRYVATVGRDRLTKVWDPSTGVLLLTLSGHTDSVWDANFSANGKRLATASWDGTVRIYTIFVEDLIELARTRITRTLTRAECKEYLHLEHCPEARESMFDSGIR